MIRTTRGFDLTDPRDASMFEDRRRLFVDLMRWDVPVIEARFEIDQFDGPDAIYVGEFIDGDVHRGSLRLLPSAGRHILNELFADLCRDGVPTGPGIYEITRLCLPAALGARERLLVRNRLISAMVDHALSADIRTLTGVVRPPFCEAILEMGWDATRLGPERLVGGMSLAAFRIEIDADTPARLTHNGIYAPVAVSAPIAA